MSSYQKLSTNPRTQRPHTQINSYNNGKITTQREERKTRCGDGKSLSVVMSAAEFTLRVLEHFKSLQSGRVSGTMGHSQLPHGLHTHTHTNAELDHSRWEVTSRVFGDSTTANRLCLWGGCYNHNRKRRSHLGQLVDRLSQLGGRSTHSQQLPQPQKVNGEHGMKLREIASENEHREHFVFFSRACKAHRRGSVNFLLASMALGQSPIAGTQRTTNYTKPNVDIQETNKCTRGPLKTISTDSIVTTV